MGVFASRQNAGVEEVDLTTNYAYRYPPKTGCYFGSHFIMGGERFDTPQPEAYLFGENSDLNFLGNRPSPFPYPAPQSNEPTKTIKSLINIRKESLRFIRVADDGNGVSGQTAPNEPPKDSSHTKYNIEFTFDSDIRCAITIRYFCTEEITPSGAIYTPRDANMSAETYHYKRGANQQFAQVSHVFDPSQFPEEELNYSFEREIVPIVIQCVAEEGEDPKQSHITFAIVEKNFDGTYTLKALKQKQFVDGLCYLLQEIYGIENKNAEYSKIVSDDEVEDNGSECVICMCDMRDTLILPCRHLCLCNCCADSLRYQASNCPICRAPFRALLQIKALRKATGSVQAAGDSNQVPKSENIPNGYEAVGLIEALNGPMSHIPSVPPSGLPLPSVPVVPVVPNSMSTQNDVAPVVTQQDAITSPSMPVPVDSSNCRNFTGSFSSIQVAATMEDCAAQTDCPLSPVDAVPGDGLGGCMPEICLTVMLPDSPAKGVGTIHLTETKALRRSRSASLEKVVVKRDMPTSASQMATATIEDETLLGIGEAQSLMEMRSPVDVFVKNDKAISLSTPDSLHLCDKQKMCHSSSTLADGQPDASPAGEESDYYTPEDPGTTILTEQMTGCGSGNRGPSASVRISDDVKTVSVDSDGGAEEEEDGIPLKGVLPTYIEAISLPGTPLSHSSNRSSGDSFSSMSSTRLLLPNQSQETLSEDRMLL